MFLLVFREAAECFNKELSVLAGEVFVVVVHCQYFIEDRIKRDIERMAHLDYKRIVGVA